MAELRADTVEAAVEPPASAPPASSPPASAPLATATDVASFVAYSALASALSLAWLVPLFAVVALGYALLQ